MDFIKHEHFFSQDRMLKYRNGSFGRNVNTATSLYKYNIQLSQAVYPLISIMEVGLRNAVDRTLRNHFKSSNWILEQKQAGGFMLHPDLIRYDDGSPDRTFTNRIYETEQGILRTGGTISHNKLVGDLNLGFWVKLFDTKPIKVLKGVQLDSFKNKKFKARDFYAELNNIKALRNRISHHEPICFDERGVFCMEAFCDVYSCLYKILDSIDDDLSTWARTFDSVIAVLKSP